MAVLLLSTLAPARAASVGQLQQKIRAGQGRISSLSGTVKAYTGRLNQINAGIAKLERRIAAVQRTLDRSRAELLATQEQLAAEQAKLAKLEAFEQHAETVLAQALVSAYESDTPDLVTVVLDSTGFQDLLERIDFMSRVRKQDVQVVSEVRAARRAVAAEATRLGQLRVRQQRLTAQILAQRNTIAAAQLALLRQQYQVSQARQAKASELSREQRQVASFQAQLNQIEAAQAALRAAQTPGSSPSGSTPVSPTQVASRGGFTFPMPRGDASPPGSWSEDQGVDISAAGGTPELAVCSGTIVLHGIGGFGPWAPVLHCDSPIDGYSYVYYGHAGPANQLAVGTHVGAGQVMSEVGPGIVGISTGPHLEIGFSDSSGSPLGGGAGTMMSLLQSSYGG